MKYDLTVINNENQITKTWSGGTTTEICTFSKSSNYEDKNFIWRISSAKVESEESNFTYLKKGFGSMSLINEGNNIAHVVKVKIVYN